MTEPIDAVVVGSGPNGLAAAVTLARAGRSVLVIEAAATLGGGLRTDEPEPGVRRDHCASIMPFAVGSPFLTSLPLREHGVEWLVPEISFTHPLDGGRAGVAHLDLEKTADGLGVDGRRYTRLVGPLAREWDALAGEVLRPIVHVPRHPITLARFGLPGLLPATRLGARFDTEEARGILAGCAAHSVLPLDTPLTAAVSLLFAASAHARGWPAVAGGAQRLAEALVSLLTQAGGRVETGRQVTSMAQLPPARAVVFDVNPAQLAAIAADRLPDRYLDRLRRFRHGPGVFKVDFVLDGPVPWADEASRSAPTVHVGGTMAQCAAAESEVAAGGHPATPFVLAVQADVIDPARLPSGRHMLWAYTHVPAGSTVDMTERIERQVERFAPGFRDRILRRWVTTPAEFEEQNPNLVGGDITGGSNGGLQLLARPRALHPYDTPDPGLFLCSASTPPGGGIHGMSGHLAARRALATALRD